MAVVAMGVPERAGAVEAQAHPKAAQQPPVVPHLLSPALEVPAASVSQNLGKQARQPRRTLAGAENESP